VQTGGIGTRARDRGRSIPPQASGIVHNYDCVIGPSAGAIFLPDMSSFTRRPKEGVSSGYAGKQLSHPSLPLNVDSCLTTHDNCKGVSSFPRTYCAEELGGLQCGDAKTPSTWFRDMPMSNSLSPRFASQHLPRTLQTINVPLILMLASVRHPPPHERHDGLRIPYIYMPLQPLSLLFSPCCLSAHRTSG